MKDINLYESGSGGEIGLIGGDVVMTEQLFQQVYLCLFGGNQKASTIGNEVAGIPRYDWWGNSLIFTNNQAKQFNSITERTLYSTVLNSVGRQQILAAVNQDLQNFKSVANITVNVVILSTNRVQIIIGLTRPQNNQNAILQFTWDMAAQELIMDMTI